MTRKDFLLISNVLCTAMNAALEAREAVLAARETMETREYQTALAVAQMGVLTASETAHNMASALAIWNERFDKVRFLQACGL